MQVRVRAIFPYPLPRGLIAGAQVTVLRVEDGACVVRDRLGREWTVAVFSVDPGQFIWEDGQWVPDGEQCA